MQADRFNKLEEKHESVLARKSWTTLELASVPLPKELDEKSEVVATEASLAEQFGRSPLLPGRVRQSGSTFDMLRRRTARVGSAKPVEEPISSEKSVLQSVRELPLWQPPAAFKWLPKYTLELLRADVVAGLTVGVVLIPQGVAYAMLAELPPIYGLYASLLPLPVYAMLCSSRHMSIGPFALVSLLVADSVSAVVPPEQTEAYISAVMLLSLMIGLLHILMAALNMGIIIRCISDSVLSGFTSAAAILISTSQLKHLLGIHIPRGSLPPTLLYVFQHLSDVNLAAVGMGAGGVVLLHYSKAWNKKYCPKIPIPEQLILLVLATFVSGLFALDEAPCALKVVGDVTSGLPAFRPPAFSLDLVVSMLQPALVVGLT